MQRKTKSKQKSKAKGKPKTGNASDDPKLVPGAPVGSPVATPPPKPPPTAEEYEKLKKEEEMSGKTYSVIELFKTPRLRKTVLLLVVIWMIISLVFDGHVRNVGSLGLDVFLTFTVAAATELPADTFLTAVLDTPLHPAATTVAVLALIADIEAAVVFGIATKATKLDSAFVLRHDRDTKKS